MEVERKARRTHVGLTVAREAFQTFREGCNYLQFEEKLLTLHLAGLDIGSMNHSVRFIKGFVDNMEVVMDKRIMDHIHAVDLVTGRKRLFAFAADKVTELHRNGDANGMLIMTEEGQLKHVFLDYLLVAKHTCHALMREIYKEMFVKKLGLSPHDIRNQCTGAAFDGQYFSLNAPEALAKMIIERAKVTTDVTRETQYLLEWLLYTWDSDHRLELVTNDIRVYRHGVDVELMSVPWYAQIPKDISAMYACCSYGKQYEEQLQTTEHLGREMVCDGKVLRHQIRTFGAQGLH
jgi:hypothetical protein